MSFQDAVTTVLTKKYADFSGRARRSEYWWFSLFLFLVYVGILVVFNAILGLRTLSTLLIWVAWLGVIVPGIAVTVRRLHDTGKSGWWILISLIPLVGPIVMLVFTVSDSTPGDNQYGPNPKGVGGGGYGQPGYGQPPAGYGYGQPPAQPGYGQPPQENPGSGPGYGSPNA